MYPGIIRIFYLNANLLPDLTLPHLPLSSLPATTEIELHGVATLSEESECVANEERFSTTLSFSSCVDLDLTPKAFVAMDASGNRHLIGSGFPHCGVLKKTESYNPPNGEASIYKYTFTIPVKKIAL